MDLTKPQAYVAFTIHFEHEGVPVSMLLDLVEVAKSHSGINLAEAFAKVLKGFGIKDKVSRILPCTKINLTYLHVPDP